MNAALLLGAIIGGAVTWSLAAAATRYTRARADYQDTRAKINTLWQALLRQLGELLAASVIATLTLIILVWLVTTGRGQ